MGINMAPAGPRVLVESMGSRSVPRAYWPTVPNEDIYVRYITTSFAAQDGSQICL